MEVQVDTNKMLTVVRNFGVKYLGKKHAEHPIQTIEEKYQASLEWEGNRYCGISITWNYQKQVFDLSMTGYIQEALYKFQHSRSTWKENAPHFWE